MHCPRFAISDGSGSFVHPDLPQMELGHLTSFLGQDASKPPFEQARFEAPPHHSFLPGKSFCFLFFCHKSSTIPRNLASPSTPPERRFRRDAAKALLKHTPREIPTASGRKMVGSSLALAWATDARMCSFCWTTDLRSHPEAQPDGLWRCDLSTLGRCAPSANEPLPEQLHLCEQHLGALSHRAGPPNNGRPSAMISNLRPPRATGTGRSRSRSMTFATLVPPSRHNRVATLSIANPRRPNTPALAHAARWWPRESRRRPQRHVRTERERGRRRPP